MSDNCNNFQKTVSKVQLRNKSILDIISKLGEANALVNRAVVKSVTYCGCVSVKATKQIYDSNKSLEENKTYLKTHVEGELCDKCKEKIIEEIGNYLYYVASLCDALDIDLNDVLNNKLNELKTLGIYSLL